MGLFFKLVQNLMNVSASDLEKHGMCVEMRITNRTVHSFLAFVAMIFWLNITLLLYINY